MTLLGTLWGGADGVGAENGNESPGGCDLEVKSRSTRAGLGLAGISR